MVGNAPAYALPADTAERYILLLLTSRRHAGQGIGSRPVHAAIREAIALDRQMLRVDCWAHAASLVGWYRRQGFRPVDQFSVNGWQGQMFHMALEQETVDLEPNSVDD